jgi:hypothetical protein
MKIANVIFFGILGYAIAAPLGMWFYPISWTIAAYWPNNAAANLRSDTGEEIKADYRRNEIEADYRRDDMKADYRREVEAEHKEDPGEFKADYRRDLEGDDEGMKADYRRGVETSDDARHYEDDDFKADYWLAAGAFW